MIQLTHVPEGRYTSTLDVSEATGRDRRLIRHDITKGYLKSIRLSCQVQIISEEDAVKYIEKWKKIYAARKNHARR